MLARMLGKERIGRLADRFLRWKHKLYDYETVAIVTDRGDTAERSMTAGGVPAQIVQTFSTSNVVRPVHSAVTRWQETNREYHYEFFDDDKCRSFIEENYPAEVLSAYDSLIPGAYRADLWRYCYLVKNGGVYVDIRMEPIKALRSILGSENKNPPRFVCARDLFTPRCASRVAYLYNAFIAAAPDHPILVKAIERSVDQILNRDYGRDSLDITGPGCLGAAANSVLNRPPDTPFELGDQHHDAIGAFRILEHTYDPFHHNILAHNGEPVIVTKCIPGVMKNADRRFHSKSYGQQYNARKVFRD